MRRKPRDPVADTTIEALAAGYRAAVPPCGDAHWREGLPLPDDWDTARQQASSNPGDSIETTLAFLVLARAHRRWSQAERRWCHDHDLADERGAIDWTRFGPIVDAAREIPGRPRPRTPVV